MPTSRLKQILDSDLVYFKENEGSNTVEKLKALNKALVEHLRIYHKYGMEVLAEEYRLFLIDERNMKLQQLKDKQEGRKNQQEQEKEEAKKKAMEQMELKLKKEQLAQLKRQQRASSAAAKPGNGVEPIR